MHVQRARLEATVIDICKMTLLYVDDDVDVSNMVLRMLRKNYPTQKIIHAENPLEAIRTLSKCDPDIFLLDLLLPYLDGGEFAGFLGRAFPKHPILFVSVCRDPAAIERCMATGARSFFPKPVDFDVLFYTIDTLLVEIFYRRFHRAKLRSPACGTAAALQDL